MPEGVEVKIQSNIVKPICLNKYIVEIKYTPSFQKKGIKNIDLIKLPLLVLDVWTRGKVLVFEVKNYTGETLYITSQLGMTGQWLTTPAAHSNFWFSFGEPNSSNISDNNGMILWNITHKLWYDDQSHFGEIGIYNDLKAIWKRHGPCLMTTTLVNHDLINKNELKPDQQLVDFNCYKNQIRNKRCLLYTSPSPRDRS